MIDNLTPALELAAQGFRVFPLRPRGKKPLIPKRSGGNGCLDATTDPEMVRAWWRGSPMANIGIATGEGLLVVDIDGDEAAFAFTDLVNRADVLWPMRTPTVLTGKGGMRMHYYLSTPPGVVLGNTTGKICDGVDTRGDGGYAVAPPSIHPDSGDPYNWVVPPIDAAPASAPDWLVGLLLRDEGERLGPRVAAQLADETSPIGARILAADCQRIAGTPEGQRNHIAFARSAAIGNLVAGGLIRSADAGAALIAATMEAGLGRDEAETVVMNGLERGIQTPRLIGDAERVA